MQILFVCMGNICRSPTAEGVFRSLLRDEGLEDRFERQRGHRRLARRRAARPPRDGRRGRARHRAGGRGAAGDAGGLRALRPSRGHGRGERRRPARRRARRRGGAQGRPPARVRPHGGGRGRPRRRGPLLRRPGRVRAGARRRRARRPRAARLAAVSLPEAVEDALGPVASARRVAGGSIAEAYRLELADGTPAFVKTGGDTPPGAFAAEAAGLVWLADAGALRVPEVLGIGDEWLALEWIETG